MTTSHRIGHGYDIHRLGEGRALILGGVTIPHSKGLIGHSDSDCLTHAMAEAILGGAGLPDIGHFFPDSDPACKGMDSQEILRRAKREAGSIGYEIANIDATVIAEEPRLGPYIEAMKNVLSNTLDLTQDYIGIKATTSEGTGEIGRGGAIAAYAVALLRLKER